MSRIAGFQFSSSHLMKKKPQIQLGNNQVAAKKELMGIGDEQQERESYFSYNKFGHDNLLIFGCLVGTNTINIDYDSASTYCDRFFFGTIFTEIKAPNFTVIISDEPVCNENCQKKNCRNQYS